MEKDYLLVIFDGRGKVKVVAEGVKPSLGIYAMANVKGKGYGLLINKKTEVVESMFKVKNNTGIVIKIEVNTPYSEVKNHGTNETNRKLH